MNEVFSPAGLASQVLSNPKQAHEHTRSESKGVPRPSTAVKPGFHNTSNATITTQKKSDYKVEQSSFTLIALF